MRGFTGKETERSDEKYSPAETDGGEESVLVVDGQRWQAQRFVSQLGYALSYPPELVALNQWPGGETFEVIQAPGTYLAVNLYEAANIDQAVDRLGDGFTATAWSESGVVEAMEHASLPILAVQFHPERMSYALRRPDANDGAKLFEWFLARCRERAD